MLTRWQKLKAFISKPTKLQLVEERIDNNRKVKAAANECARLKEWNLFLVEMINKKGDIEQLKAMLSCSLRGMTVTEVINFANSQIPQEIQK